MSRQWLPAVIGALLCAPHLAAAGAPAVHAWQDSIQLPTYRLGEPSPVPQFPIFDSKAANYPYPAFDKLTKDRQQRVWRTLNLENEYLFCRVLPDLGGHLYSCRDKRNNREMFYANPVIKPGDIGLRGAWDALGIESNFPAGHSRTSISPVDFAVRQDPDGSGRAIVEDTDRITGMTWRVEYILHPESAVLELRVTLTNGTAERWPFYWWSNAGIAFDDPGMRMVLPAHVVSTHTAPSEIEPWPVTPDGKDGTVVANHKQAGGWFAYGSHEPFFAVFKPASRSGLAHYAQPDTVEGKKLWLWGSGQDEWVKHELTDDFPSYVEMQSGRFQSQDTFQFLVPRQSEQFSEFWIPVCDLGGVTRVTRDVVLNLQRDDASPGVLIELIATHPIHGAFLHVLSGKREVLETQVDLDPKATFSRKLSGDEPFIVQLVDRRGTVLLRHVEGRYEAVEPGKVKLGLVPKPYPDGPETEEMLLARGEFNELQQQWGFAWHDYSIGLGKFPANAQFAKAAGNVALNLNRFDDAARLLATALAANASDTESLYGLGLALSRLGQDAAARERLARVSPLSRYGPAAAVQLAMLSARSKDYAGALALVKPAGALTVPLLRLSGKKQEALKLLDTLYAADPADSMLRFERTLLGSDDEDLWKHLSLDGERVLDLAGEYLDLGDEEDALRLLSHPWPPVSADEVEPGALSAAAHPLIAYYRAYVHARLGQDAAADLRTAAEGVTRYVFPHRWRSAAVLNSAVKANPSDAHARLFLGRLLLYRFNADEAIAQWQEARKLNPALPELARDLGRVLAEVKHDPAGVALLKEALKLNPADADLPGLIERATAKPREPEQHAAAAPSEPVSAQSVARQALLKAAAGHAGEAEYMFDPKIFAAEKQPDAVRQAWIEVQLQKLLEQASAGRCTDALNGLLQLGNENAQLGFTLYGFSRFMQLPHFQYYTAAVESMCHEEKSAKKRWSKVSRMSESLPSPEFVYPLLAAARIAAGWNSAAIDATLESVRAALPKAEPGDKSALVFAEAVLLRASHKDSEALLRFQQAAKAPDPMVAYLALTEMNQPVFAK